MEHLPVAFGGNYLLASGSDDNTIKLWNTSTGYLIRTLTGHTDSVRSVKFSNELNYLASGSKDSAVKIWNSTTGALYGTRLFMDRCRVTALTRGWKNQFAVAWSGSVVIIDKNNKYIWFNAGSVLSQRFQLGVYGMAFFAYLYVGRLFYS